MTRSRLGRGQLKMIARPGAKDVLAAKRCASEHGQASLPSLCFWFFSVDELAEAGTLRVDAA